MGRAAGGWLTSALRAHSARHLQILGSVWGRLGAATPILRKSTLRLGRARRGCCQNKGSDGGRPWGPSTCFTAALLQGPAHPSAWSHQLRTGVQRGAIRFQKSPAGTGNGTPVPRWAAPHPVPSGGGCGTGPWGLPVHSLPQTAAPWRTLMSKTSPSLLSTSSMLFATSTLPPGSPPGLLQVSQPCWSRGLPTHQVPDGPSA